MPKEKTDEFDFSESRDETKVSKEQLLFVNHVTPLSDAQKEFNRLMKRLEREREKRDLEEKRLESMQKQIIDQVIPLIEECNLMNRDICFLVRSALDRIKFSARQRALLEDLLCSKVRELLEDPAGLGEEDCIKLEAIVKELEPEEEEDDDDFEAEYAREEFATMRSMLEDAARRDGLDIDLSDLDPTGDPAEFHQQLEQRLRDMEQQLLQKGLFGGTQSKRKPTKAQQEKERKRLEQEEAKQKDLKSLYKQLAKAIHPDLEKDPEMKLHKESWMKRLTAAHAAGDLSELLRIEMEWLGEESDNLAKASEDKLKTYHAVLKEQIRDMQQRIKSLVYEPQFQILGRFIDSFFGSMPSVPKLLHQWKEEKKSHQNILGKLQQGDTAIRHTLKEWAEFHHQSITGNDIPF